jgi:hypothetical protein
MYYDAAIDVGCGIFSWHVEEPPKPPALHSRVCHDPHKHSDVHSSWVDTWSGLNCRGDKKIKAGDPAIYWHPVWAEYHQNYKISWIEGCSVTSEQSVEFPIADDRGITCGNLLRDNYYDCKSTTLKWNQADAIFTNTSQTGDNGGAGGWIDAGCVRYEFYVT